MVEATQFHDVETLGGAILPGPPNALNVVRPGMGTSNTDTLSRLARRFMELDDGLITIRVRPPFVGLDAGTVGLAQIADGLLARTEIGSDRKHLIDPSVSWSNKLEIVEKHIEQVQDRTILLCDEPYDWASRSYDSNRYSAHARDLSSLVLDRVNCRRVVTSKRPGTFAKKRVFHLDDAYMPSKGFRPEEWGSLASSAIEVVEGLRRHHRSYSRLEVGLLVALTHVSSFVRSRRFLIEAQPADVLAHEVNNMLAQRGGYADMLRLWRAVSLLRRPCDGLLLRDLKEHLRIVTMDPEACDLLTLCLLMPVTDGYEFPPVLRETARTAASVQELPNMHATIARIHKVRYEVKGRQGNLSDAMEAFHHASESGDRLLIEELQPFFVDQLDARGRALSRQKSYFEAVEVFRQAVKWDDDDDYAHHYLAYNLDVEGREPVDVETHYSRAIELDRTNVWWWSRYITFLIIRGRNGDARRAWGEALEELALRSETDFELYDHLHLWVARVLLHRARIDFARQVLNDVPEDVRKESPRFRALDRYLHHLEAARSQEDVFPLTINIDDAGNLPHLSARYDHNGSSLTRWLPGRVDEVTGGDVEMTIAVEEDPSATTGRVARRLTMPRSEFDARSRDIRSDRLHAGTFIELAFYGQDDQPVIRVHPKQPWHDADLPYIFPRPDRYLRKAASAAE